MPRKNKNTTKHPQYKKPDYHSQNKSLKQNNDNDITKKRNKKNKLRRSYDIYKRLLHDPTIKIDLNYIHIGYQDIDDIQEMPFLDWIMIDDGGDIPMHKIQYFVLYLIDETKIVIWDKKNKIDRLYCSGHTNNKTESLKSLLSQMDPSNIPSTNTQQNDHNDNNKPIEQKEDSNTQNISKPIDQVIGLLDSLISIFDDDHERKYHEMKDDNRQIGILFMGGSYNPVHSQHIQLMAVIKNYFETKHNINIIGGYLVITTNGYVAGKLKDEAISFVHRKKLCELMVNNDKYLSWLHPSQYEIGSAIQYLQNEFLEKYPNGLMINCMGADKILRGKNTGKWRKYAKNYKQRQCLTVCIRRKGYNDDAYDLYLKDVRNGIMKKKDEKAFMFIDVEVEQVSSTLIRKILKDYQNEMKQNVDGADDGDVEDRCNLYKDRLVKYVNDECAEYLLRNINEIWYKRGEKKKKGKNGRNKICIWDD